jgi:hypothetical protein
MPINNMIINTGLVTDYTWLQKGYSYGVNDTGPWQKFSREGLYPDIVNWAAILDDAGWIYTVTRNLVSLTSNQGVAKIEAEAGWPFPFLYGTEVPEDIWELDPQDEQKDLPSSNFPNGTINFVSKDTGAAVAKMAEDNATYWLFPSTPEVPTANPSQYVFAIDSSTSYVFDLDVNGDPALAFANQGYVINYDPLIPDNIVSITPPVAVTANVIHLPIADAAAAYSMWKLITAGVTSFPFEASIIRHSMITSNNYSVPASYTNVDRIISTASMYAIEDVPTGLFFDVPSTPTPQQFIETPGDLQYGWRKVRPAVARLSRMKWRIVQNYAFGLYPIRMFGNVL